MTRAELLDRVAVLEEALAYHAPPCSILPPQQARIASVLRRGPLPPAMLADVMGLTRNCLARHISAMRLRGMHITCNSGAYRMEGS